MINKAQLKNQKNEKKLTLCSQNVDPYQLEFENLSQNSSNKVQDMKNMNEFFEYTSLKDMFNDNNDQKDGSIKQNQSKDLLVDQQNKQQYLDEQYNSDINLQCSEVIQQFETPQNKKKQKNNKDSSLQYFQSPIIYSDQDYLFDYSNAKFIIQQPLPNLLNHYIIQQLSEQNIGDYENYCQQRLNIIEFIQIFFTKQQSIFTHKAIHLFDLLISKLTYWYKLKDQQLKELTVCIIHITNKMNSTKIVKIQELIKLTNLRVSLLQFKECENFILDTLDWQVNPITLEDIVLDILLRFLNKFQSTQNENNQKKYGLPIIEIDLWLIQKLLAVIIYDIQYINYNQKGLAYCIISIIYEYYGLKDQEKELLNELEIDENEGIQADNFVRKYINYIYELCKETKTQSNLKIYQECQQI